MAGIGPQKHLRFGAYDLDCRAGELRKQGVKLKLQEQPLDVLLILLEKPGEIVSREELQQKIWRSDTFVDFEHGLYNAIKRLREALGDNAEKPEYIETVPRRGYRFVGKIEIGNPLPDKRIQSLAVLPLENLSGDPEQEYFAEGLTEALITTLAKIGELRVVSRTSAMQYKGVHKALKDIARELDVDVIVEGTVLRADKRVRISAQLIDGSGDRHMWAESYERDMRDILSLHSEVARAIAREIRVKLTPVDQAHFAEVQPVDPDAYEFYLQGRYHWNKRSGAGLRQGVQWFQQAIAKDPTYTAAQIGLADCLTVLGWGGFVAPADGPARAISLLREAIEREPSSGEAHASLGFALMLWGYDFASAEREFERSIELSPRYASAHQWFGLYLGLMGRFEEGYTELLRAVRLDPLSLMIRVTLGFVYWCWRQYDQAVKQFKKALEIDPNFLWAHGDAGFTYVEQSKYEDAIASGQKAVEFSQGAPAFLSLLADEYAMAGRLAEARNLLQQLLELSKERYVTPYMIARIHAALGERDESLRWLEVAYQERAAWMVVLKIDPRFDTMRSDPNLQDLLRRMNFPSDEG